MLTRNSSNDGGCQAGGEATFTDRATATGEDKGREGGGIGAGAGIDTGIQVVKGLEPSANVGIDTVTEALTCRRASAWV
jgi:hypothetical protein